MSMTTQQANLWQQVLIEKLEGHLFLQFYMMKQLDQAHPCVDYYTLRGGNVYIVHPDDLREVLSFDDPINMIGSCMDLGPYEEEKVILHEFRWMKIPAMIELLKGATDEQTTSG